MSQAFGLVQLNGYEPELGYISITELVSLGAELDVHWRKQTLSQVRLRLDGAFDGTLDSALHITLGGADFKQGTAGASERLEIV